MYFNVTSKKIRFANTLRHSPKVGGELRVPTASSPAVVIRHVKEVASLPLVDPEESDFCDNLPQCLQCPLCHLLLCHQLGTITMKNSSKSTWPLTSLLFEVT